MKNLLDIVFLFTISLSALSSSSFGFVGVFEAPSLVPSDLNDIEDVKFDVYNYAVTRGQNDKDCGSTECYRMDVYINDVHVATWPTSPGKRHPGTKHVGSFTPIYNGRGIHMVLGSDYVSYTRKYPMPYAMFINSEDGKITDYALHSGYEVNGERLSRGCLRLRIKDAERANLWVRMARSNGGNGYIWTRHTQDVY